MGRLLPLLFSVCVPTSVLVTLVFWGVLVPGAAVAGAPMSNVLHFTSYNMHLVNTLLLLLEFAFDRLLESLGHTYYDESENPIFLDFMR